MTDLLWALFAVAVLAFAVWFARWAGPYYGQPEEPTLLNAPLLAEQQHAADADSPVSPNGGAR